ncbi:MAG: DUF58 domain-containing protein [Dehalococcoidia bacterium]
MVFRQIWLAIALLLLLVGVGIRQPPVAAVGALVLLAGGVSRLWSRLSLERLSYQRALQERRAFVGEEIEVTFSIANRKLLPLPWVEVRELVPEAMPARDARTSPSGVPGSLALARSTALSWYERVSWRYRFHCRQRGYFHFGPALVRSGDIFGLFPVEREIPRRDYLTVLPRLVDLPALGLPAERPFGEARSGRRIFEDPSRIVGVRDYRPGDPLKRIDWKATARRQALQSRIYEPSSSLYLLVALNVNTLEFVWEGYDPVLLERAVTVAGSVARWGEEQRYAVGMVANSSYPGADRPLSIPPARDPDQLTRILEGLAMVSPFTIAPLDEVLEESARRLPMGATIVVVAGYLQESLAARIVRLHDSGWPVTLLWVNDGPPPFSVAPAPTYDLGAALRAAEREWLRDQPVVRLAPLPNGGAAGPAPGRPTSGAGIRPETTAFPTPAVVIAPPAAPVDEANPDARWARPRT